MSLKGNALTSVPEQVLITGGAGFIGSHLAEVLLERGHDVTIIDDLSTGRFENIAHLCSQPRFHFTINTILNESIIDRLISNCHLVFHLAAAVGVRLIIERPIHTIEANILGTREVLKAAARYRVPLLLASSSEVYGKGNAIPFREDDDVVLGATTRGRWAYAVSKMMDEFLALAYHREKGLPVVIFRLFNTIGARQTGRYGMVIPRFVEQAFQGKPLTIYGDGSQSRCFLHVGDAVEAILALAACPQAVGQVFNIGSTDEISITDLAKKILALVDEWESKKSQPTKKISPTDEERLLYIPYEQAFGEDFDDMQRRVPDISKIHRFTGWQPKHTLEEALRDVIEDTLS